MSVRAGRLFRMSLIAATALALVLALLPGLALAEGGTVAQGVCGTCTWDLDAAGTLKVAPQDGRKGILKQGSDGFPWAKHKSGIYLVEFEKGVSLQGSAAGMFSGYTSLDAISFSNLDTSGVTDMSSMFRNCGSLTYLDLPSFDTSNVTDMSDMFNMQGFKPDWETSSRVARSELYSLDLSNFNTSKVTNMSGMFSGCDSLGSLDLSGFDTSNVTDMSNMFRASYVVEPDAEDERGYFRSRLSQLNLSNFDTSNVTDMHAMFYGCGDLQSLDLSSFDTFRVTDMHEMFYRCSFLKVLDLTKFNMSNVKDMSSMFNGCRSLKSLDIARLSSTCVKDMSSMFRGCSSLKFLDLSGFQLPSVVSMANMFSDCSALKSLDLAGFKTSRVEDMSGMFERCSSLRILDLSSLTTTKVRNMSYMFNMTNDEEDVSSPSSELRSLNLSGFDTFNVKDMSSMFSGCGNLKTVLVGSKWHPAKPGFSMFVGCSRLMGGNGTKFSPKKTGAKMAIIDKPGQKGYLTGVLRANPMKVKGLTVKVKASKLKLKSVKVARVKAIKFKAKAKGRVSYKRLNKGSSKALSIAKKTGVVKVKKGTSKGLYKLRVEITTAGNSAYAAKSQVVTVKVHVR